MILSVLACKWIPIKANAVMKLSIKKLKYLKKQSKPKLKVQANISINFLCFMFSFEANATPER